MSSKSRPITSELESAIRAFVALFSPHLEAVLHDVQSDRIAGIWNSFSDRTIGSASLLEASLVAELVAGEVLGPYAKVESNGRSITSVSVPLVDNKLLLCLNFDRSVLDGAIERLTGFAVAFQPQSRALFELDWRDGINELIDIWCREHGRHRERLSRIDRLGIITLIDGKGYFGTRYSTAHVARGLTVSRATVYSLLKESRAREGRS